MTARKVTKEGGARPGGPEGGGAGAVPAVLSVERQKVGPLPVWGWALLSALAVWALYVITLAPTTAFWDTSEYIATAHILGIPHPPGNPFFVMLGRVWDVLLAWTGLTVAQRINLLSATASAGAAFLWFLTMARIWAHFTEDRRHLVVACVAAVLVGGTAFTVWNQSNVNAKVYTVALLFLAVITYLAMLWEDVADSDRGDRLVLLVAFLLGLGATNHLMSLLPLGALGVFVLFHRPKTLLRPRLMSAGVLLAAVGFSVQTFFVPIRSAQEPLIDEADPECESLWAAAVTPLEILPAVGSAVPDEAACEPLRAAMAREQYGKPPLTERQSPFTAQMAMYGQYFNWQWARTLSGPLRIGVTCLFVLLGLVGLWQHWTGDRDSFVYFAALLVTVIPVLIFYLNFRYGYSLYPEIPMSQHEVRERDYFFLLSFNLWGLYAGLGIATLWRALADRLSEVGAGAGGGPGGGPGRASLLRAAPVLGVALIPLVFNFGRADRSGDYSARDWAYNLLQSVEPYGVVFTNGDNDTFPLWYLQEVEGIRQDVTVIVHSYLGTRWYPKQLKAMTEPCEEGEDPSERPTVVVCQRPFDEEAAVEPYRGTEVEPPTRSILPMPEEEIDKVPPYRPVREAMNVRITDQLSARLRPENLRRSRGQSFITSADLYVYLVMQNALGDRPVHFASTAPPVFGVWELGENLLRQGLSFKLVEGMLESTADTVRLDSPYSVPWVDRVRSQSLLWNVFQVEYLLDWAYWPEPSTRSSIPAQYWIAYTALGDAQRLRESPELAQRNYQRAQAFVELGEFGGTQAPPPEPAEGGGGSEPPAGLGETIPAPGGAGAGGGGG